MKSSRKLGLLMLTLLATRTHALELKDFLQGKLVSREDWKATVVDYESMLQNREMTEEKEYELISLHHSASNIGNNLSDEQEKEVVRAIQALHMKKLNLSDVGYHFMLTQSGAVFVGRPLHLRGAHSGYQNTKNLGLAFVGCYDSKGCPEEGKEVSEVTDAMIASAARVIAFVSWKNNFEISKDSIVLRSEHEFRKTGKMRFPYSPGNRIEERFDEIISKAKGALNELKEQVEREKEAAAEHAARVEEERELNDSDDSSSSTAEGWNDIIGRAIGKAKAKGGEFAEKAKAKRDELAAKADKEVAKAKEKGGEVAEEAKAKRDELKAKAEKEKEYIKARAEEQEAKDKANAEASKQRARAKAEKAEAEARAEKARIEAEKRKK